MRDYVSIAPRHKPLADLRCLVRTVFEAKPTADGKVARRVIDEVVECGERVRACGQSEQRFECQRIALEYGVVRIHIGWIRGDDFEAFAR